MWIQMTPEQAEAARAALIKSHPEIAERFAHYLELERDPRTKAFREASVDDGEDGVLEFDADAVVSLSDSGGAYVMSWSWVDNEDAGLTPDGEVRTLDNTIAELVKDWLDDATLKDDPTFRSFVEARWKKLSVEAIAEAWDKFSMLTAA